MTHFDQETFDAALAEGKLMMVDFWAEGKLMMVDFWAEWCGPCRMLAPMVDKLAAQYEGKVTVGKVNVDECPELARQFRVMNIPTLLLFRGGELVDRQMGFMPAAALKEMIDTHKPGCHLEVDGGVDMVTAEICKENGADVLVAGSAFYKAADKPAFVQSLES